MRPPDLFLLETSAGVYEARWTVPADVDAGRYDVVATLTVGGIRLAATPPAALELVRQVAEGPGAPGAAPRAGRGPPAPPPACPPPAGRPAEQEPRGPAGVGRGAGQHPRLCGRVLRGHRRPARRQYQVWVAGGDRAPRRGLDATPVPH